MDSFLVSTAGLTNNAESPLVGNVVDAPLAVVVIDGIMTTDTIVSVAGLLLLGVGVGVAVLILKRN